MVLRTVGVLRTVMGVRLWSRCDGGMTKGETVTGRWYFVRLGCFARLWASGYGRDATEE